MNYEQKYNIAVELIKKGYIIHCTDEDFDYFDPSYIKGGCRAKEGYGFYFSDMAYKPIEYGSIFKVVKKNDFNFINAMSPIDIKMFDNPFEDEISYITNQMYNTRNFKEYEELENRLQELKQKSKNVYDDLLSCLVRHTIKQNNLTNIGSIEYYLPNPNIWVPKLVKLYQYYGYDGYECDGVYTIFNFEKLNRLAETIDLSQYTNNINENFDLASFKIQDTLNPNFWKDDKLDSRIRLKLLDIADDFVDFLEVDWVKPEDITITGSIANYNWSKKYSDIDLHIIIDFKKVDKKTNFVKNYFDSKKDLWNQEHKDIKIYGFNIEVYVQDKNEKHSSSGVYSLEKNEWIIKPKHISDISNKTLKSAEKNAEKWSDKIIKIINRYYPDSTDSQKEKIITDVDAAIKDIKKERIKGLSNGGNEMNPNNITFKMLRRNGDIDKLYAKKREIYNDLMSINEGCWGYELFDNDDSLDKRDDFIKKTLKYLTNNLDKADAEITGSGSEKFSWATLLYDFIIKNKKESSYLDEYQQALKKCIDFFEKYKTKKYLNVYSEPEKMKKTIEKSINELKKCISSN